MFLELFSGAGCQVQQPLTSRCVLPDDWLHHCRLICLPIVTSDSQSTPGIFSLCLLNNMTFSGFFGLIAFFFFDPAHVPPASPPHPNPHPYLPSLAPLILPLTACHAPLTPSLAFSQQPLLLVYLVRRVTVVADALSSSVNQLNT